ncbi:MAG: HAD family hydrolase [Rhodobacteraceae bacterium]|nr:HAD family hydrolase [Paracoccaceae bacterium]
MRADGILFDKDGTLFDFTGTWAVWAKSFLDNLTDGDNERAYQIAAAIGFDYVAGVFAPDSVVVAHTPDHIAKALLPYFDLDAAALADFLNAEAAKAKQAPATPLKPLFTRLKSMGVQLGIATNDAEAPARAHLESAGVTHFFDYIVGYDSGHGGKPAPGQCLGFLEATGLRSDRVVMVGDSLHDLHAGAAAGMQVVGVLTGLADADELSPHADIVLPDIGHLPAWLAA